MLYCEKWYVIWRGPEGKMWDPEAQAAVWRKMKTKETNDKGKGKRHWGALLNQAISETGQMIRNPETGFRNIWFFFFFGHNFNLYLEGKFFWGRGLVGFTVAILLCMWLADSMSI